MLLTQQNMIKICATVSVCVVTGDDQPAEQQPDAEQEQQQQQPQQPAQQQHQGQPPGNKKPGKPSLGGLQLTVGSHVETGEWKSNGIWIKKEIKQDEAPSNLQVIPADDLIKVSGQGAGDPSLGPPTGPLFHATSPQLQHASFLGVLRSFTASKKILTGRLVHSFLGAPASGRQWWQLIRATQDLVPGMHSMLLLLTIGCLSAG